MGSGNSNNGGCSLCRLINCFITLAILGVGGYVLWYFLGQPSGEDIANTFGNIDFGDFTDVLDNFTGFGDVWDTDPYVGDNTTQIWRGTDGEGGLNLELYNALDDTWQAEYAEAVNDWENCDPDALTLTTTEVPVDNACSQVDGVMKVCNGNYGDTGWLGINEVLKTVPNELIQSSVAKMNEYYLNNADYNERLYTMCHEVGHGFGLPHTDENFNNKDLGNCMDYTNRPQNNLRPGAVNCNKLATMYGIVGGGGGNARSLFDVDEDSQSLLRKRNNRRSLMDNPVFAAQYDLAMKDLEHTLHLSGSGRNLQELEEEEDMPVYNEWRVLHETLLGGVFVRRLNEDLALEAHVLYPRN